MCHVGTDCLNCKWKKPAWNPDNNPSLQHFLGKSGDGHTSSFLKPLERQGAVHIRQQTSRSCCGRLHLTGMEGLCKHTGTCHRWFLARASCPSERRMGGVNYTGDTRRSKCPCFDPSGGCFLLSREMKVFLISERVTETVGCPSWLFSSFFFFSDFVYLFIFRERGREGEREGGKH